VALHYRRPVGLEHMRDLTGTGKSVFEIADFLKRLRHTITLA
jgi:hypothetical protein